MVRAAAVIATAALLSACTTSNTTMIAADQAILSVQSHNGYVGSDSVFRRTLQEGAKLTLAHGYRYFQMLDAQDTSRTISMVLPGAAQTTGTVSAYGNSAYYNGTTTYSPAQRVTAQWIGNRVRIKMYTSGTANVEMMYDCQAILAK